MNEKKCFVCGRPTGGFNGTRLCKQCAHLRCGACGKPLYQCHVGDCPWGSPDIPVWIEEIGDWVAKKATQQDNACWECGEPLGDQAEWGMHPECYAEFAKVADFEQAEKPWLPDGSTNWRYYEETEVI